jgi:hypothetical protein
LYLLIGMASFSSKWILSHSTWYKFRRSRQNHVLLSERGVLQPRVPYQGWLLAVGGLMPKHLRNGEQVDATLVIIASDRTEYMGEICLFSERRMAKPKVTKRESSIHERPARRKIEPVAPVVH